MSKPRIVLIKRDKPKPGDIVYDKIFKVYHRVIGVDCGDPEVVLLNSMCKPFTMDASTLDIKKRYNLSNLPISDMIIIGKTGSHIKS